MAESTPEEVIEFNIQDENNLELSETDSDTETDNDGSCMTVVEHLEDLRIRVIRSIAYITLSFFISFIFTKDIMRILQKPAGDITFQALSIEEPVMVFFKVSFYTALIIASPLILFEVSRFVGPGLTTKEKRVVTPVLVGGPAPY